MKLQQKYDAIVILGGTHTPGYKFPKDRMDAAIHLYKKGFAPCIIVTGIGQTEMMSDYALENGIEAETIVKEPHATNTAENLHYTKKILADNKWSRILVVTSDFHVPRTKYWKKRIFGNKKGFACEIYAANSGTGVLDLVRRLFVERIFLTGGEIATLGVDNGDDRRIVKKYKPVETTMENLTKKLYKTKIITN